MVEKNPVGFERDPEREALEAQVARDDAIEEFPDVKDELAAVRRKMRLVRYYVVDLTVAVGRLADTQVKAEARGNRRTRVVVLGFLILGAIVGNNFYARHRIADESKERAAAGCQLANFGIDRDRQQVQAIIDVSSATPDPDDAERSSEERQSRAAVLDVAIKDYVERQGFRFENGRVVASFINCADFAKNPEKYLTPQLTRETQ